MDSVIVRQTVLRGDDGFLLGETALLPCRISSDDDTNDFHPVLCAETDPGYARVLEKLQSGSTLE